MLQNLQKIVTENNTTPFLVSELKNIMYCTGFTGSYGHLIIDRNTVYFITSHRKGGKGHHTEKKPL